MVRPHVTRPLGAVAVALLSAAPLLAGFAGTDMFLPSVGAKAGVPPSVWYTTVWVHNPGSTAANVTFYLLERDKANVNPLHVEEVVPPGATRRYDNAVEVLFNKKLFGALRVTSSTKVIVSSRVFSQAGTLIEDSVGQFFAGIPSSFALSAGESTEIVGGWQTQPASTSLFRFNYGFVETTGIGTCQARVTVKDQAGTVLASKTYTVRQWEQVQKALKDEFPSVSDDNVRLTVEVTSSSTGRLLAFGSAVANGSQDASTLEMKYDEKLLAPGATVLAPGGVVFGGSSGELSQDAASLFWDDAADRLGIGTATPSEQLELTGNLRLPATATGAGQLFLGSQRVMHAPGSDNFFLGPGAGNLAVSGTANVAVGGGALAALTSSKLNTAVGYSALASITDQTSSTAVGAYTLATSTAWGNTAVGTNALRNNTTGPRNTAVGVRALMQNVSGEGNAALGLQSLESNTEGTYNVAVGLKTMFGNLTGDSNTAVGYQAMYNGTAGSSNTAVGVEALFNTTTDNGTAVGSHALYSNTTGTENVAVGTDALWSNTEGWGNAALGSAALRGNATGVSNTAVGTIALFSNESGNANVAVGQSALRNNTSGSNNIAVGYAALLNDDGGSANTAVGDNALVAVTAGSGNIGLGSQAGAGLTNGSDNIYLGSVAGATSESGVIRIGTSGTHTATYLQGVAGAAVAGANPVYVQADGRLGTAVPSSIRFKTDVQALGDIASALLDLRPVRFRYRPELDPSGAWQYGLIAEEVAEVAPELVIYSPAGEPEGVRYHLLDVLLLEELQRQYRRADAQAATIDELRCRIDDLTRLVGKLSALVEARGAEGGPAR